MDAKEQIGRVLGDIYYIADMLQFAAEILQLPNCNDCVKTRSCQYMPGWGKTVRYNCPFWQGKCDGLVSEPGLEKAAQVEAGNTVF